MSQNPYSASAQAPDFQDAVAVVVNTPFAVQADALYIGVSGDVTIVTAGGHTVQFKAHPVGYLRCACTNVTAATATNMLALNR